MTDQKTPDGTQERPEGGSATPAPPEGSNGPQAGAQSLQRQQQPRGPIDWARHYAAQHQATGRPTASTITQQQLDTLHEKLDAYRESRRRWRDAAYTDRRIALVANDRLARVRELAAELFVAGSTSTERAVGRRILSELAEPGEEPDAAATEATDGHSSACHDVTGIRGLLEHVGINTTGRDIAVAGRLVDPAPAHWAGPSIREAADNDRRWPLEKHGE